MLALDRAAADRALSGLARSLGLRGALAAAEGVVRLAEAHIEAALRTVSVERGHDPRGAALVAFGGAGGLHACAVAEALGVRTVLAPRDAGMLSALGALTGGLRREATRTLLLPASETARLEAAWRGLERRVLAALAPLAGRRRARIERWAEMRYVGQSHELPVPGGSRLAERFHHEHARRFGFSDPDRPVEVVTVEARATLPGERPPAPHARSSRRGAAGRASVRDRGRVVAAPIWERESVRPGLTIRGPALVLESGATLWIPAGWRGRAHASGTLVLERGEG
jgi:N-methylhydantoinase A